MGENARLVAMLSVRKASTSRPVGISNVRMIESMAVAISHLESGENAWGSVSTVRDGIWIIYKVQNSPLEPPELSDDSPCLDIHKPDRQIIAYRSEQTAIAMYIQSRDGRR